MPLSVPGACNEAVNAPDMDSVESLKALWDAVKSLPGWDVLELRSVYENTPIARLAELAHSEGYKTGLWPLPPIPWLELEGCHVEKLPPRSTLRSRLLQADRRLSELGTLNLRTFEKADEQAIRRFYGLEGGGCEV